MVPVGRSYRGNQNEEKDPVVGFRGDVGMTSLRSVLVKQTP